MYFRSSARSGAVRFLLALALIPYGCTKHEPERGLVRIAVAPPENLTGDASQEWISIALREVLVSDLTGISGIQPVAVRKKN